LIAIDHLVKRHPVDTQDFGGLCDIPVLLLKNLMNIILFHLLKGTALPVFDRGRSNEREVLYLESTTARSMAFSSSLTFPGQP
jgi:hypothetical protein